MKYTFIDAQRSQHAVRKLCKALQVSASGYYAARGRPPSARAQRQSRLAIKIREVHIASRQTYGAPRVHAELAAQGIACCRNTVAKLMRREQIVPRAIRAFRLTTDSRSCQGQPSFPQFRTIEFSPPGSRFGCLFGSDQAGFQLFLEAIRGAADVQGHGVMQ